MVICGGTKLLIMDILLFNVFLSICLTIWLLEGLVPWKISHIIICNKIFYYANEYILKIHNNELYPSQFIIDGIEFIGKNKEEYKEKIDK